MKQSEKNETHTVEGLTIMRKPPWGQTNLVLPAFKYDENLLLTVFFNICKMD